MIFFSKKNYHQVNLVRMSVVLAERYPIATLPVPVLLHMVSQVISRFIVLISRLQHKSCYRLKPHFHISVIRHVVHGMRYAAILTLQ